MSKVTNRIVLRIELYSSDMIKITLVYLDKRFLSKDGGYDENVFKSYHCSLNDNKNSFFLYSRDKFFILHNAIRFPDEKNYKPGVYAEKLFKNGQERYEYLKDLHKALNKWNDNYKEFIKCDDHPNRKKGVKFNGEFWIL